jgi:hypothetical protein
MDPPASPRRAHWTIDDAGTRLARTAGWNAPPVGSGTERPDECYLRTWSACVRLIVQDDEHPFRFHRDNRARSEILERASESILGMPATVRSAMSAAGIDAFIEGMPPLSAELLDPILADYGVDYWFTHALWACAKAYQSEEGMLRGDLQRLPPGGLLLVTVH